MDSNLEARFRRASDLMSLFVPAALNQFDLVTFRRVDERNRATVAMRMRPVRERITFLRVTPGECSMSSTSKARCVRSGPTTTGPLSIEFADLDFLLAARRLEENQLRTAAGGVPPRFLQTENVPVKGDRFFQIGHPITSVKKLLYHGVITCACLRRKFKREVPV